MATEAIDIGKIQTLINNLEGRNSILSTYIDRYKTLASHFSSLQESLNQSSKTLESQITDFNDESRDTIERLDERECSISDLEASFLDRVQVLKDAAMTEFEKPAANFAEVVETLVALCKRMDYLGLYKFLVCKRKSSSIIKAEMRNCLAECVDPARLVLDAVEEFLSQKEVALAEAGGERPGRWLTDKRWVCGALVSGLFPLDELKESAKKKGDVGQVFARKTVERAVKVVEEWRRKEEERGGEGLKEMEPLEGVVFLQLVVGFGLIQRFEDEFLKKLVMGFSERRGIEKVAIPIFREKIEDIIDELVKSGKEIDALYFASEAGLMEKFRPISLIKTYLRNSKKTIKDILEKGLHSAAATVESNNLELVSIKATIKCVEDHKLEQEFPLDTLRKRLDLLEKAKFQKKRTPGGNRGSSGSRPHKAAKFSKPPRAFGRSNTVQSASQSPVTRYSRPYSYPSQTTYDAGLAPPPPYSSTYGGTHPGGSYGAPPSYGPYDYGGPGALGQPHYTITDSVGAGGFHPAVSYGAQTGYGSYNYSANAPPSYPPSSYTQ